MPRNPEQVQNSLLFFLGNTSEWVFMVALLTAVLRVSLLGRCFWGPVRLWLISLTPPEQVEFTGFWSCETISTEAHEDSLVGSLGWGLGWLSSAWEFVKSPGVLQEENSGANARCSFSIFLPHDCWQMWPVTNPWNMALQTEMGQIQG